MKHLLTIIFLSLIVSSNGQIKKPKNFQRFYSDITKQFKKIDKARETDFDLINGENNKLITVIKSYKEDLFNFPDTLDYDLIYLTKSKDNKLALVSWDTRMGGTMIAFTTIAVYKTDKGVHATLLGDTTDEISPYTYMHYNAIKTIQTSDKQNIYLAVGYGQGSTALPWQRIQAFTIINSKLVEPNIFPKKNSSLFVEFDTHAFKDSERIPTIKFKNDDKQIDVPIENEKLGFSGKYKTYLFDGKRFNTK